MYHEVIDSSIPFHTMLQWYRLEFHTKYDFEFFALKVTTCVSKCFVAVQALKKMLGSAKIRPDDQWNLFSFLTILLINLPIFKRAARIFLAHW